MSFTLAGIVTDTVDAFVNALLDWMAQAWGFIVATIVEATCPLITELLEDPAFVDFASDLVQGWNTSAPYISQANYYVPVVESLSFIAIYQAWTVAFAFVRAFLKIIPGVW